MTNSSNPNDLVENFCILENDTNVGGVSVLNI